MPRMSPCKPNSGPARTRPNARQQAFTALRSMTADVVEKKFTQSTVLTEDDRRSCDIIKQFDAFAAIKGDDADSRALRGGAIPRRREYVSGWVNSTRRPRTLTRP